MVKIVLLAAVVVLGVGWLGLRHERAAEEQTLLGLVASSLAGRSVHVRCQSSLGTALDGSGEAGSVLFDTDGRPADSTDLKHDVCQALERFRSDVRSPAFACALQDVRCSDAIFADVQAVHTLAHESAHLAGQQNESLAECRALQTTAYAARRLGAGDAEASAVASYAYRHLYPNLPPDYQAAGCSP